MTTAEARILLLDADLLTAYARQQGLKVTTLRQIAWMTYWRQKLTTVCRRPRVAY